MINNNSLTIEQVAHCNHPHVCSMLFEFKMTLDLFFDKDHEIFILIIGLTKNIAHLFNKIDDFINKEDKAIKRLKRDLESNHSEMAIKMPPRGDCEKLFGEIIQEAILIRRMHAKIFQILFSRESGKPEEMIKYFKEIFGEHSNEYELIYDNNPALQFLWEIRNDIEHIGGGLKFMWLTTNGDSVSPSFFNFNNQSFITRDYILHTTNFLLFFSEFLIASGLSYRLPNIKYGFNPNPKEGEFRWQSYMVNKVISP